MPDVVIGPLYLLVALFPALFPKQANNLMDGNHPNYEPPCNYPSEVVVMTDMEYDPNDAKVLSNLTMMMENAHSPETKRIWTNKREEFLRQMRWRKEQRFSHGSERRNHTHG